MLFFLCINWKYILHLSKKWIISVLAYVYYIYHLFKPGYKGSDFWHIIRNSIKENNIVVVKSITPDYKDLPSSSMTSQKSGIDSSKRKYTVDWLHCQLLSTHDPIWMGEKVSSCWDDRKCALPATTTTLLTTFETSAQWAKTLKILKLWYLLFTWLFGLLCSKRMSNNFVFNNATKTLFFKINIFLCLCSLCPLRLLLWLLSIMAGSDSLMVVVTKWEACNRLTRGH